MVEQVGTILAVDDNAAILQLLQSMLSRHGYQVRTAGSGRQALESARLDQPDLILLDIMMPGMDGYQVCERLKADPQTRDIPVIFVSAMSDLKDKLDAFNLGGVDYVTKPFQIKEVLARVGAHVALRAARRKLDEQNIELERTNAVLAREIAERRRAEEALHLHAARLKVQRELHQSILAARSPEAIAMAAIGRVRQLIPCQRAIAIAIGEDGVPQVLAVDSSGGIAPVDVDVYRKLLENPSLSDGRVRGCENLDALAQPSPEQQALCAAGIRSYVFVPLLMQGKLVGTLHLESKRPAVFTPQHITVAAEVATSLEMAIRQARLYEQVQQEKQRADELLLNILPPRVVQDLKEKGQTRPQSFEHVTVCFADIVNFTIISAQHEPEFVIGELNEIFTAFDDIMERNQCERIKTTGDAYLAVCGMPEENENHAQNIVQAAIEMVEYLQDRGEHAEIKWQMRIGVHSGPVVGGIVGIKKYIYDVFGDTINTAARMESNSEPMKINVSASTYHLLKDKFHFIKRGALRVKGKGNMWMHFVDV